MEPLQGSCLCGGVRFEVTEPFIRVSQCHCTFCKGISVSSGISRGTRLSSEELSIAIVSFIAGAAISTAACALSYFAPSTMFAHLINSASGVVSNPKLIRAISAIRLVQEI